MTTATDLGPISILGDASPLPSEEGAISSSTNAPVLILGGVKNQSIDTSILVIGGIEEEICRICQQALQVEGMPNNEINLGARAHVRCLQPPAQVMRPPVVANLVRAKFPWREVLKTALSGLATCFGCCKS